MSIDRADQLAEAARAAVDVHRQHESLCGHASRRRSSGCVLRVVHGAARHRGSSEPAASGSRTLPPQPLALLARLGVDTGHEGRGMGAGLLADALTRLPVSYTHLTLPTIHPLSIT